MIWISFHSTCDDSVFSLASFVEEAIFSSVYASDAFCQKLGDCNCVGLFLGLCFLLGAYMSIFVPGCVCYYGSII